RLWLATASERQIRWPRYTAPEFRVLLASVPQRTCREQWLKACREPLLRYWRGESGSDRLRRQRSADRYRVADATEQSWPVVAGVLEQVAVVAPRPATSLTEISTVPWTATTAYRS